MNTAQRGMGEVRLGQAFPDDVISNLVRIGTPRRFVKGEPLFLRGDPGDFVVLIKSGLVAVSITSASGRTSILAHMGAKEVVGEISALDGGPRSADATAHRTCDTVLVSRPVLLNAIADVPGGTEWIIKMLCYRVRNASDMFETMASLVAPSRLARCLLNLGKKWGVDVAGGIEVGEMFSQSELGDFSGVARENVNRLIRNWCEEDKIAFYRGQISILDKAWLEAMADGDPTAI